jgi:hypothetical protein
MRQIADSDSPAPSRSSDRGVAFPGADHQPRLGGLRHLAVEHDRLSRPRFRRLRESKALILGVVGHPAAAVPPDGLLDVAGKVVPQVPAICHLDRVRCAGCRAFGIGAGTVPADHPRSRVIPQPLRQRFRLTALEQVDWLPGIHVDHNK